MAGFIDLGIAGGTSVVLVTMDDEVIGLQSINGFSSFISGPFLKAALPTAYQAGQAIYVSDATGAHVTGSLCVWNGTSWIDQTTGIAVA